jgi:predicted RecA/RadA family phage recombinase
MATNYVQEGKTLNYTASGADIASGDFVLIGTIGGVAKTDIADGKTGAVHICGVFSIPKASGAITQGAKLYWSTTNSNLTTTASGNTIVGVAAEAAASGDANAKLLLNVGL